MNQEQKPRKHYTQMSAVEVGTLVGFVRAHQNTLIGSSHYYDRVSERSFTYEQAVNAIGAGKPIEVNKTGNDVRALFRRQSGPNAGTCAVISLKSWDIITVYYNDPNDQHDTLNHNLYRWNVDVSRLVAQLKGGR